jgi:hypothetical protein
MGLTVTAHIQKPIQIIGLRLLTDNRSISYQGQASLTLGGSDDHTVGGLEEVQAIAFYQSCYQTASNPKLREAPRSLESFD